MHAPVRRMPAERVRHARRDGHMYNLAVVDATNATTNPQAASAVSTQTSSSAAQSSSSTPGSSPAHPSSTSASPSPPTSSTLTSSTPTSSSPSATQPATPTSISSPPTLTHSAVPSTSTDPPTSPSTSAPLTNAAAVSNNGLSGGAIAGIIAGAVIVGVAIIVFLVRKTYLRRRERKYTSWNGAQGLGAGIPDEPKFPDISEQLINDLSTPQASVPLSPFEAHGQSMYSTSVPPVVHMRSPTIPVHTVPTLPPATYNNPPSIAAYPSQPLPLTYNTPFATGRSAAGMSTPMASVHAQHVPVEATVRCTFVPNLPDELSITTGERVFVLEQYDDGWDLCANGRGERGMVPRDCLEHAPSDQPDMGWRNARRTSSLNPDGNRF